jgi:Terpene cyclase DEP1
MEHNNGITPVPRVPQQPNRFSKLFAGIYFTLSIIGLVGTWYFNLQFFRADTGQGYLEAWFANDASSSAAIDLIVILLMACVFFFREGLRIGWRWYWIALFIPLSVSVALACAFPLFLGLRELHLARHNLESP